MKAELRPKPHSRIPGAIVIEVWHEGQLIGTVTGADGPGIRFHSKHQIEASHGGFAVHTLTATVVIPARS